jgi:CRP/FNR family cyclic AMP-dependent transcriptional regulator
VIPTDAGFVQSYRVLARSLLARQPGFERCPAPVIDALLADAEVARVAAGEVVAHRGQRCEHLLLVAEGALEARMIAADGRRHLLAFMLPGTLFGLLSIIDGAAQPHDAAAHVPSIVLKMPALAVQRLHATLPALGAAFELLLVDRSRRLYHALAERMLHPLSARLAGQLAQLADDVGVRREGGWTIALHLTQADLADLLGAGRQSVNAELRRLQQAGLVRVARSHIDVIDLDELRARAPQGLTAPGASL